MKNIIKSFILLAFFCWLPSPVFSAEVTYYHTDAMGTPMAMTDSSGKVVWQGDFYPFGEEYEVKETPNKNKRRFTGKEKDEESGLHYFGARYMDEASGRFVSPDPVTAVDAQTSKTNTALLGNPLRMNRYVYGLNNPYRYIDPDGRMPKNIENSGFNHYELEDSGVRYGGGRYSGKSFGKALWGKITGKGGATNRTTQSGIGVTRHSVQQKINRQVRSADELDAIRNPLDVRSVKVDKLGRPSQRSIGRKAEVVRNPKTGNIVSVNPTSTKKAERLLRRQGGQ